MIESMLDNDLYKFTMQQAVHSLYPWAEAKYVFINRGGTQFPEGFDNGLSFRERLQVQIAKLAELCLSEEEHAFLKRACPFLSPVYLDHLRTYRYNPDEVTVDQQGVDLSITIEGPWYRTILWEVPLMAIISELYAKVQMPPWDHSLRYTTNTAKAALLRNNGVAFADFGTRRRHSSAIHNEVLSDLLSVEGSTLVGTSNVHFARKYGIKPIGTMAHEWIMFHAAVNGYSRANKMASDAWVCVYQGDLGIALTDTYTTEAFLLTFDIVAAKLYDGVRQDSGDPFAFADRIVAHYQELGIDPLSKTIVFSDSLSAQKAVKLQQHCAGKIKASFGIGTHLTNDVGVKPLNMVVKMSHAREHGTATWHHAVKLSDSEGKHTGEADEVAFCKRTIERMSL